jgi:hypothetical protein
MKDCLGKAVVPDYFVAGSADSSAAVEASAAEAAAADMPAVVAIIAVDTVIANFELTAL